MRIRRSVLAGLAGVAVIVVAGSLAACGSSSTSGGSGGGPSVTPTPKVVVFTEADNGKTVTVKAGQSFRMVLKENPTTGYAWNMIIGPGLVQETTRFVGPTPSASPLAGAGGTRVWTVRAVKPGTRTITGVYEQSWNKGKNASDFSLTVNVTT